MALIKAEKKPEPIQFNKKHRVGLIYLKPTRGLDYSSSLHSIRYTSWIASATVGTPFSRSVDLVDIIIPEFMRSKEVICLIWIRNRNWWFGDEAVRLTHMLYDNRY